MAEHPAVNRRVAGSSPAWGVLWSVGQGVKTPPFHGGNMGSNPIRIIIWRHSQVVRQRSATPLSPVQIRVAPPKQKALRKKCFLFWKWSALTRMKNEAGLRPMKRAFGSRRGYCALRFMATKLPLHRSRKASASYRQSRCFIDKAMNLWYTLFEGRWYYGKR